MRQGLSGWIAALSIVASTVSHAGLAAPVVYTNETAWRDALKGLAVQTETFSESSFFNVPLKSGETTLGILSVALNADDPLNYTKVTDINPSATIFEAGLQARICDGSSLGQCTTTITLSAASGLPMGGFAADWGDNPSDGDILTLTVNNKTYRFNEVLTSGNGFLGIYDSDPFTEVVLGIVNPPSGVFIAEAFTIDNARIAAVPSPAALGLLASVLPLLGWRRRT